MKKAIEIFKTLSVPSRLSLLLALRDCNCDSSQKSEACMTDLSNKINMSLPNVQRNIKSLQAAGLVEVNKVSRTCYCKVTKLGEELINLLTNLDET